MKSTQGQREAMGVLLQRHTPVEIVFRAIELEADWKAVKDTLEEMGHSFDEDEEAEFERYAGKFVA